MKWLRYTFQLKNCPEISIENDSNSSTMIIRKTCIDDAGIFTCLIENPAGATKTSTNLTVMENQNNQCIINQQQKQESSGSFQQEQSSSSQSTSESCQKQSFISQTHVTSKSYSSKQSTSSTTEQYDILQF